MLLKTLAKRINTPLVHFLSLGLCLFIVTAEAPEPSLLFISQAQQQNALEQWANQYGQSPPKAQQELLLEQLISDQLLLDQARLRELQKLPVVQTRLKQLDKFLAINSQENALAKADLALELSDPLIRQYMINAMREILISEALLSRKKTQSDIISAEAVANYYQKNAEKFLRADKYQLNHIYIGGLNTDSLQRAENLFEQVQKQPDDTNLGDAFAEGRQLPLLNAKQLQRKFGGDIATASPSLQLEQWSQPVASGYGYHLLYLVEKKIGSPLPLEQVSKKISQTLQYQLRDTLLAEQIRLLKQYYQVELEAEPKPLAASL